MRRAALGFMTFGRVRESERVPARFAMPAGSRTRETGANGNVEGSVSHGSRMRKSHGRETVCLKQKGRMRGSSPRTTPFPSRRRSATSFQQTPESLAPVPLPPCMAASLPAQGPKSPPRRTERETGPPLDRSTRRGRFARPSPMCLSWERSLPVPARALSSRRRAVEESYWRDVWRANQRRRGLLLRRNQLLRLPLRCCSEGRRRAGWCARVRKASLFRMERQTTRRTRLEVRACTRGGGTAEAAPRRPNVYGTEIFSVHSQETGTLPADSLYVLGYGIWPVIAPDVGRRAAGPVLVLVLLLGFRFLSGPSELDTQVGFRSTVMSLQQRVERAAVECLKGWVSVQLGEAAADGKRAQKLSSCMP